MISVKNLTRKYGDLIAVNDVSFDIAAGEIVGLLGHNGAGKTTIMKMLTGYLEPNSGSIEIAGTNIESDRITVQKKIGYLPENCPVYPEMTVIDYLEFVAELRDINPQDRPDYIRDAIQKTELQEKATDLISTLSKGYRQRVGIAQAILHKPQILILDEPTSGLDPTQIHEIRALIRELSKSATIILSTHILQEVEAVCGRVIIMLQGRIALDSELDKIHSSNRLLLSVDGSPDQVSANLKKLNGIKSVQLEKQQDNLNTFVLEVEQNGTSLSPLIAKAVIDQGLNLFSLSPERRDLDTVFKEINEGRQGGSK
ncbi:MAG: ABC transporter ATP-binding protein [Candidatus Dadabacteria bacterium]|nr:MAG: ABC transporter ATP-binding protein [Candidatus Dadabacteria bacterium]